MMIKFGVCTFRWRKVNNINNKKKQTKMYKLTLKRSIFVAVVVTIIMSQQISSAPAKKGKGNEEKFPFCVGVAKKKCTAKEVDSHNAGGLRRVKKCIKNEVDKCLAMITDQRANESCLSVHTIYLHQRERLCLETVEPKMCFWFAYEYPVVVCVTSK